MAQADDKGVAAAKGRAWPRLARSSRFWLQVTLAVAALTCALVACTVLSQGHAYTPYVRWLAAAGIVATWALALYMLRQELLKLALHERSARGLIRRFQLFAAALTLPFFALPATVALRALVSASDRPLEARPGWLLLYVLTLSGAVGVALYFRWAVLSLPLAAQRPGRRGWAPAHRRRWNWGGTGLNARGWPR